MNISLIIYFVKYIKFKQGNTSLSVLQPSYDCLKLVSDPVRGEVYLIQYYVIKFVSDL